MVALLLATAVFAQNNLESNFTKTIPRYDDFPLDNIHILRLQDAAVSLGGNVSALKEEVSVYQEERSREIVELSGIVDNFQRSLIAQVSSLESSVDRLSDRVDNRISGLAANPELEVPASTNFPPYMAILLGANIVLFVIIIILIVWLREQYYVHRETHKEEHIHPAPPELISFVKHQLEHDKNLRDIRMALAEKGWSPSIIEHAIHAARER